MSSEDVVVGDVGPRSSKRRKVDLPGPKPGNRGQSTRGRSRGPGRGGASAKAPQKKVSGAAVDEATLEAVLKRKIAHVHLFFGVYQSPVPSTFIRQNPNDLSVRLPSHPPQLSDKAHDEEVIEVILTSQRPRGSTGIVHGGVMDVGSVRKDVPITVKLAFSRDQKSRLVEEYSVYLHLHSNNVEGIPHCFGYFVDIESGPHALIMTHAGKDLHDRASSISASLKRSFQRILESINKAGVIHGDIRLANLCVSDEGKPFIIDFSHSEIRKTKIMGHDVHHLCEILNIKERMKPFSSTDGLRRSNRIKFLAEKEAGSERHIDQ